VPYHLYVFILAFVLRTPSWLCPRTSRMALRHPASAGFALKKRKILYAPVVSIVCV